MDYVNENARSLEFWVGTIDKVLWTSMVLCITVILIKLFRKSDRNFQVLNVPVPIDKFWVVALGLTLAHLYCTLQLMGNVNYLMHFADKDFTNGLYADIVTSNNLFFNGMKPRVDKVGNFVTIPSDDKTAILHYASGFLLGISLINFKKNKIGVLLSSIVIGICLVAINWVTGTNWAYSISIMSL
jgi:hypothetical protein